MAYFLEHMEPTAESIEIHFPEDILEKCRLVYRLNNVKNVWEFHAFWDSEVRYGEDDIIVPVQSVYDGTILVIGNTPFVNVVGSKNDPLPRVDKVDSWIGLIKYAYTFINNHGGPKYDSSSCCTDGKYYNPINHAEMQHKCCCGTIVGGHVLTGYYWPQKSLPGSDVYLLPICQTHNVSKYDPNTGMRGGNVNTGTIYYMKTKCEIHAVKLRKFLQRACVDRYINKYGLENIKKI